MQDGENPPAPQWGLKSCTKRGRVLDCTRERIQVRARVRDKGSVYERRGGAPESEVASFRGQRARELRGTPSVRGIQFLRHS